MTTLSISTICKDIGFIDYGASQHLTFRNEVFSTFGKFTFDHKVYLGDKYTLDVYGKCTIVLKLSNGISKCIGDVLYMSQSWQRIYYSCQFVNRTRFQGGILNH